MSKWQYVLWSWDFSLFVLWSLAVEFWRTSSLSSKLRTYTCYVSTFSEVVSICKKKTSCLFPKALVGFLYPDWFFYAPHNVEFVCQPYSDCQYKNLFDRQPPKHVDTFYYSWDSGRKHKSLLLRTMPVILPLGICAVHPGVIFLTHCISLIRW